MVIFVFFTLRWSAAARPDQERRDAAYRQFNLKGSLCCRFAAGCSAGNRLAQRFVAFGRHFGASRLTVAALNTSRGNLMTKPTTARSVEESLVDLFRHLGIEKAHIAAGRLGLTDWQGLATRYPDRVASLTLINPPLLDERPIRGVAARTLVVAGDSGPTAEGAGRLRAELPGLVSHSLRGFECHPWS